MKKITTMIHSRLAKLVTIAAALAAFTGATHAQEALKIALVDIEKVRASYWKTQMSLQQAAERRADFKKAEQGLIEDMNQIAADYTRLVESARDPANSQAKREADAQKAQGMELKHRQAKVRHAEYNQSAERTMREMSLRLGRARLDEIKEVVAAKSKAAGCDIVINSSENVLIVVYSAGKNDLTNEIITELNKEAPEEYTPRKPASAEGATTPAAPAPAEK
jgi:Skp family chaperone for outer membrane proteins